MANKKRDIAWEKLVAEIKEAKKDPQFMKDLKKFIRITTS